MEFLLSFRLRAFFLFFFIDLAQRIFYRLFAKDARFILFGDNTFIWTIAQLIRFYGIIYGVPVDFFYDGFVVVTNFGSNLNTAALLKEETECKEWESYRQADDISILISIINSTFSDH